MCKHLILLVTTASVAAAAFALAQGPMPVPRVRGTMPVQYVADRPDFSGEQPSFLSEDDAAIRQ
jgi:hypothetical protein